MRDVLIIAFLGINIVMPLRYYFGDEAYDERFAWRMFSPVRMLRCDVDLYGPGGRELSQGQLMHVVWINLLKRGRLQVLEAFAQKYCADETAAGRPAELYARMVCPPADGPHRGICRRGLADTDRDGVPDGFNDARECAEQTPKACYEKACAGQSAADCFEQTCRLKLVDRGRNLCDGGAP
ncbi:MAG: hypothetical protein KC613_11750 [Myxococcales bacterium]|nr:hypothetical protein [Myxococcales bacterium]MCB9522278.1 hypothetical protein [Myxococcales bacterium]